jgi:hypothetical protein
MRFAPLLMVAVSIGACPCAANANGAPQRTSVACAGEKLDPYVVWDDVWSDAQAEAFLRGTYERIGAVEPMAHWLACQTFKVNIITGPSWPSIGSDEVQIQAYFGVLAQNRAPLYGSFLCRLFSMPWAMDYELTFGPDGKIARVEIGYTVE